MRCCNSKSASSVATIGGATGFALLAGIYLTSVADQAPVPETRVMSMSEGGLLQTDRQEIDATIARLYEVISGPAGEARDWDRFREMFTETGQLAVTLPSPDGRTMMSLSPDDYVERFGPSLTENGFRERETHRVLEIFGSVAHAFSTYRGTIETDPAFVVEGINSIQLVRVGGAENASWKVHSILWHQKLPDEAIPNKYRPAPAGDL